MQPNSTIYKAALYMRLSKDDYNQGESSSIINQRKMLVSFAEKNSFKVIDEYIDDGWSGTNFDRPNFKRMIQDIESKKIAYTKNRLHNEKMLCGLFCCAACSGGITYEIKSVSELPER